MDDDAQRAYKERHVNMLFARNMMTLGGLALLLYGLIWDAKA